MDIPSGAFDLVPLVPIAAIVVWGTLRALRGPVGQALVERLRGSPDPAMIEEVSELRIELQAVRADLDETQERLDVTRRLLAQDIHRQRSATPI